VRIVYDCVSLHHLWLRIQKEPGGKYTDLGWSIYYGDEFFEMTEEKLIEED
jgi:hypothetical protein